MFNLFFYKKKKKMCFIYAHSESVIETDVNTMYGINNTESSDIYQDKRIYQDFLSDCVSEYKVISKKEVVNWKKLIDNVIKKNNMYKTLSFNKISVQKYVYYHSNKITKKKNAKLYNEEGMSNYIIQVNASPRLWDLFLSSGEQEEFMNMLDAYTTTSNFFVEQVSSKVISGNKIFWPDNGKITFLWKDYLNALRINKKQDSFTKKEKIQHQKSFLYTFEGHHKHLRLYDPFEKQILGIHIPIAPNKAVTYKPALPHPADVYLRDDNQELFHPDMEISIYFGKILPLNIKENIHNLKKLYENQIYKTDNSYIERNHMRFYPPNLHPIINDITNTYGLLPPRANRKNFIIAVRSMIHSLTSSVFGFPEFTYQAAHYSLREFCEITRSLQFLKSSRLKEIQKLLYNMNIELTAMDIGRIIYPMRIRGSCSIYIAINTQNFNQWKISYPQDLNELMDRKSGSSNILQIQELVDKGKSIDDIYDMIETTRVEKRKVTWSNILTKSLEVSLDRGSMDEIDMEQNHGSTVYVNKKTGITYKRSCTYTTQTEYVLTNKIQQITLIGIQESIQNLKNKLKPIIEEISKLTLEDFFKQEESYSVCEVYHEKIQSNFLISLNDYFTSINNTLKKDPIYPDIEKFFGVKLSKERNLLKKIGKLSEKSQNWYSENYFFDGIFPIGYKFSLSKIKYKKKKSNTFLEAKNRVEELMRIDPENKFRPCSLITCERKFRKSFQANIAHQIFPLTSPPGRGIEIDAKGLHANIAIFLSGENSTTTMDWTEEFSRLENYLLKTIDYKKGFLESIGIDRDSVKKHLLALLNGRKIYTPLSLCDEFGPKLKCCDKLPRNLEKQLKEFFVSHCQFTKIISKVNSRVEKMEYFLGTPFPDYFDISAKLNLILQSVESLLTISVIYDILNSGNILQSVERDGIFIISNDKLIESLNFTTFKELNKKVLNGKVELSTKLLVKANDVGLTFDLGKYNEEFENENVSNDHNVVLDDQKIEKQKSTSEFLDMSENENNQFDVKKKNNVIDIEYVQRVKENEYGSSYREFVLNRNNTTPMYSCLADSNFQPKPSTLAFLSSMTEQDREIRLKLLEDHLLYIEWSLRNIDFNMFLYTLGCERREYIIKKYFGKEKFINLYMRWCHSIFYYGRILPPLTWNYDRIENKWDRLVNYETLFKNISDCNFYLMYHNSQFFTDMSPFDPIIDSIIFFV